MNNLRYQSSRGTLSSSSLTVHLSAQCERNRRPAATITLLLGAMFLLVVCATVGDATAAMSRRLPRDADPSDHAYPALGMTSERKVPVAWNQYYDSKGLSSILARLHRAFPDLTRLYSIGQSVEGRELWCLEVTARQVGDPDRKPGMYIDGNIHGNEVQAGEVVAYTGWYLCHQYGKLDQVTELLDRTVFYLLPSINPDGRDRWFHQPQNTHSSRTGVQPVDNDRDGLLDEDDVDDLDGDGSVTQMRIKDPYGRYKPHPKFPEFMIRVEEDERGEYTLLGNEGLDNDGDGRVNEDPAGGYDMNRNWAYDWQPNYIQGGAHDYPFSLPETRAIADFFYEHPNIAGFQSYHNFGGMILRSPGREGGNMQRQDERILSAIADRGVEILPFYRSMIIFKDLYTVWGGEIDWAYNARGILGFTDEIWTMRSLYKGDGNPSDDETGVFLRYVLLNDGVVPWKAFDHPTYGPIEIGGHKKQWFRTPPSFLLEEECHRNMAFTLFHADQMPWIEIVEMDVDAMAGGLFNVRISIANRRMIPTRTRQDVEHNISPPDIVSLSGSSVEVLTAGRVRDRFFNVIEPVMRRPERVELDSIGGMDVERVQFIVSGRGDFRVRVDSAKGGLLEMQLKLPEL